MKNRVYTAEELVQLLRQKYSSPDRYVVLEQVADSTGIGWHSWIDAVVLWLWPSDGIKRAAFEVKVSRQDWLHEIQRINKNAWAREYFHEFWFLAPDFVIQIEELPEGSGWMKPVGSGLRIMRAASRKDNPACDDALISSLARSMQKYIAKSGKEAYRSAKEDDIDYSSAKKWEEVGRAFLQSHGIMNVYTVEVSDFERASGDAGTRRTAEQMQDVLIGLRSKMQNSLAHHIAMAYLALDATDEAGQYLLNMWNLGVEARGDVAASLVKQKELILIQVQDILKSLKLSSQFSSTHD